jgi:hypothetical protein
LIEIKPEALHVLMCKPVEDGGYAGARDPSGPVKFSVMTLRTYWPNWLKIMTDNDRTMCACETCQTSQDLHSAYLAKRKDIVTRSKAKLKAMTGRSRQTTLVKVKLTNDLNDYEKEIFVEDPDNINKMKHKYDNGWDACDQYGCGARKFINGHTHPFVPYVCQKGDCLKCQEAGYTPPVFETSVVEIGEMIRYSRFAKSARCTVPGHGSGHIQRFASHPRLRCKWCEDQELKHAGWKAKNKSSISERKKRQIFHVPFADYIGNDGVMVRSMKKMFRHKQNVRLLGKNMKTTPREKYVKSLDGKAIMLVRDFMEKMGIDANNEMQFQYFMKSVSLGGEGITVYLKRPGQDQYETRLYTVLSTEKNKMVEPCTPTPK